MRPPSHEMGADGATRQNLRPSSAVLGLIIINVLIELLLAGADAGLWGTPLWRGIAYHNGAFWAGLLDNWRPNYSAQPAVMFFSYAFLHSGFGHLIGNMMMLWFLALMLDRRAGQAGFLVIYGVSVVSGAAVFFLLNASSQPMVGASGALFGLIGAWKFWEWRDLRRAGRPALPVWRDLVGLAALNVILWYMLGGLLAWETHLGGFIGGWVAAAAWFPRRTGPPVS